MELRTKVRQYIIEEGLIASGDHVIVGLSGGADSVCLLMILKELAGELMISLSALHVNHGIRGSEADQDQDYCRALCQEMGIPFSSYQIDVPGQSLLLKRSEEETARILRYSCFEESVRNYRAESKEKDKDQIKIKVALAHHLDDQAETVLMNLCRGSGIRGLGGIPAKREPYIRPLLSCRRQEIEEWLKERGVSWCTDSTNLSSDYTRNRVRQEVLPWLTELVNARAAEHLAEAAAEARTIDACLEEQTREWLFDKDPFDLPADGLRALPQALRDRILHRIICQVAGQSRDIGRVHVAAAAELLSKETGAKIDLPGGVRIRISYGRLIFEKRPEVLSEKKTEEIPVKADFRVFPLSEGLAIPEKRYTKWFDYDKINCNIVFRRRRSGDRITLAGGGHKSVQSYMKDVKIPADERNQIPILAAGDEVLWILGYRMNAAYQLTDQTRNILEVVVREVKGERCDE